MCIYLCSWYASENLLMPILVLQNILVHYVIPFVVIRKHLVDINRWLFPLKKKKTGVSREMANNHLICIVCINACAVLPMLILNQIFTSPYGLKVYVKTLTKFTVSNQYIPSVSKLEYKNSIISQAIFGQHQIISPQCPSWSIKIVAFHK